MRRLQGAVGMAAALPPDERTAWIGNYLLSRVGLKSPPQSPPRQLPQHSLQLVVGDLQAELQSAVNAAQRKDHSPVRHAAEHLLHSAQLFERQPSARGASRSENLLASDEIEVCSSEATDEQVPAVVSEPQGTTTEVASPERDSDVDSIAVAAYLRSDETWLADEVEASRVLQSTRALQGGKAVRAGGGC